MSLPAPFPYFGGKRRAAQMIWDAFGDPSGYVEPFCGSAAVLLARPACDGRRVETINDADGWLVNTWRSIRLSPDKVAEYAAGPVTEIDYHARLAWLQERRSDGLVSWLEGSPEAHDPKAAAWWLYVAACGIGDPWGGGPWRVEGDRLVRRERGPGDSPGVNKELPHLGNAGQGIHRKLPHLGNAGQVHTLQLSAYMRTLAARLERVRITCGSWERVVKPSAYRAKTGGDGSIAILLDPPYSTSGDLYAEADQDGSIGTAVREWCRTQTGLRIVLCGYENEHDELLNHGWRVAQGKAGGGAGYSVKRDSGRRERLWFSPECLSAHDQAVLDLDGGEG